MHTRIDNQHQLNEFTSQLALRPQHLARVERDQNAISKLVLNIKKTPDKREGSAQYGHYCEVWSRIKWSVKMTPQGIFHIHAKDKYQSTPVMPFGLFYHTEKSDLHIVACFQNAERDIERYSTAKIVVKTSAKMLYHMGVQGAAYVISINNMVGDYRIGTTLIQAAIELSVQWGFDGRVILNSEYDSGQFYFKLGFQAMDYQANQKLVDGQKCSGGLMQLSNEAITIWKEKIAAQPVFQISQKKSSYQNRFFEQAAPSDEASTQHLLDCRTHL